MKKLLLLSFLSVMLISVTSCKKKAAEAPAPETEAPAETSAAPSFDLGEGIAINSGSTVNWKCSRPGKEHFGTINVSKGNVAVENGAIVGGGFVLDMNSVSSSDLEGDYKAMLEAHLKGTEAGKEDDFFNVNKYPNAHFKISKVTALENDPDATHLVYGDLTMRDVTKSLGFKAQISADENGVTVNTPEFKINRTDFGIKFRSTSFFDNLKDKAIDDEVTLSVNLTAGQVDAATPAEEG